MTLIRVWLSHDGYKDPDDNLAMLLGSAYARSVAQSSSDVRVAGVIYGDTKDGAQYYMLHPTGTAPAAFGTDSRYSDVAGNKVGAGNYAFFTDYAKAALKSLGPNWKIFDLLASDNSGLRAWNFDATKASQITAAAQAVAADIEDAIAQTGSATTPAKIVVYSAGGAANVAAEAIGYLLNQGHTEAELQKYFVVVQHGNNWVTNYEDEARELTRDFTIAISNQNYAEYANGADGPDLKHALSAKVTGDTLLPTAFDTAIAVATGGQSYQNLPSGATFKTTLDASDAGSHAFAVNKTALLAAMADRLSGTEELQTGYDWAHLIDSGSTTRLREIYASFDAAKISTLLWGSSGAQAVATASAAASAASSTTEASTLTASASAADSGELVRAVAASGDDRESHGGSDSDDLDLGLVRTKAGTQANTVTLSFGDLGVDPHAEIASAYLLFEAKRDATAGGSLTVAAAGTSVDWDDLGSWKAGESYRSADLAPLVEAALAAGSDTITFTLEGTGSHVAQAFDSGGTAPQLVIDWTLG